MKRANSLKNVSHRKKISPWSQLIQAFIINKHPRVLFHLPKVPFEFHEMYTTFIRRMTCIWENSICIDRICLRNIMSVCIMYAHKEECVNNPVLCCMCNFV